MPFLFKYYFAWSVHYSLELFIWIAVLGFFCTFIFLIFSKNQRPLINQVVFKQTAWGLFWSLILISFYYSDLFFKTHLVILKYLFVILCLCYLNLILIVCICYAIEKQKKQSFYQVFLGFCLFLWYFFWFLVNRIRIKIKIFYVAPNTWNQYIFFHLIIIVISFLIICWCLTEIFS